MKKILFILPSTKKMAPIQVALDIINNLNKECFEISLLTFNCGEHHIEFKKVCKNIIVFNSSILKNLMSALKFIKYNEFDIIHSHGAIPDVINALQNKSLSVSTLHNYITKDYIMERGVVRGIAMASIHKIALNRINVISGCSKSVMEHVKLSNYYIRNGVSGNSHVYERKKNIRPQFLVLGRIIKRKNLNIILEAFLNINNADLIIVGDGAELNNLKLKYKKNNIFFEGYKSNVHDYYQRCDFYISASKAEGLPLSLLDALSHGLPFIVSQIPPHNEILELTNNSCFSFNGSSIDLVNKINCCINMDSTTYDKKSNEIKIAFRNNFTTKIMASNYSKLYMELTK